MAARRGCGVRRDCRFVVIAGLVVDRGRRQQGIGRLLMAEAERWAREQGCSIVRLWSSKGRADAHAFYRRLGYADVKTQHAFAKSLDGDGQLQGLVPNLEEG
jgi:GNAT superfamily N-acetyltransferase